MSLESQLFFINIIKEGKKFDNISTTMKKKNYIASIIMFTRRRKIFKIFILLRYYLLKLIDIYGSYGKFCKTKTQNL